MVKDNKVFQKGARLVRFQVDAANNQSLESITVSDWLHPDGDANDLESICKLPNTDNEYLVTEAGAWKGKFGRIFKLTVGQNKAEVKAVYDLPIYFGSDEHSEGKKECATTAWWSGGGHDHKSPQATVSGKREMCHSTRV